MVLGGLLGFGPVAGAGAPDPSSSRLSQPGALGLPDAIGDVSDLPTGSLPRSPLRPNPLPLGGAGTETGLVSGTQVASRLSAGTRAVIDSLVSQTQYRFFLDELPLITLQQYLRAGYVIPSTPPFGKVIRNYFFWNSISHGEMVFLDVGARQGVKKGDKFLVYQLNYHFGNSFEHRPPVFHPVIEADGGVKEARIATNIWDMKTGETGVWRKKLDMIDQWTEESGGLVGDSVRIVGEVEVTGTEADLSRAEVLHMWEWFPRGAYLIPYPKNIPQMLPVDVQNPVKDLAGYVLQSQKGYLLSGENDILYIDQGQAQNVEPGDRFVVLASTREEDLDHNTLDWDNLFDLSGWNRPALLMDHVIGELVVITTQQNTSTALVVDSSEPILPGHRIESKAASLSPR